MFKNRILYIVWLLFCSFFMFFFHHYSFLIMLILSVILPIISYILTKKVIQKLDISVVSTPVITERSNNVEIKINVENNTKVPVVRSLIYVLVENNYYKDGGNLVFQKALLQKEMTEIKYDFESKFCGQINILVNEIKVFDFLGLFCFRKKIEVTHSVIILPPKKITNKEIYSKEYVKSETEELLKKGELSSEISDIRMYIPGDKLQKIHWKLSAKHDDFMVKEFSEEISEEMIVFLELYHDGICGGVLESNIVKVYNLSYALLPFYEFKVCWFHDELKQMMYAEIRSEEDILNAVQQWYLAPCYMDYKKGSQIYRTQYESESEIVLFSDETSLLGEEVEYE